MRYQPIDKPRRIVDRAAVNAARRDVCELCGVRCIGEVHHARSRGARGNDEPSNLISLCLLCHRKVHDGNVPRQAIMDVIANR